MRHDRTSGSVPIRHLTAGVVNPMPATKLTFVSAALLAVATGAFAVCTHQTIAQDRNTQAAPDPARVAPPELLDLRNVRMVPAEDQKAQVPEGTWLLDPQGGRIGLALEAGTIQIQ